VSCARRAKEKLRLGDKKNTPGGQNNNFAEGDKKTPAQGGLFFLLCGGMVSRHLKYEEGNLPAGRRHSHGETH